jgi:trimethylamine--corrinoid protein Co-methyltransferase
MTRHDHTRPGIPASPYRPLSDRDVTTIADAALTLLERSGMVVYSPTAFEAFRSAGAEVDESTRFVRLPRSLVEDAIASNPSSITLYARDDRNQAVLE